MFSAGFDDKISTCENVISFGPITSILLTNNPNIRKETEKTKEIKEEKIANVNERLTATKTKRREQNTKNEDCLEIVVYVSTSNRVHSRTTLCC